MSCRLLLLLLLFSYCPAFGQNQTDSATVMKWKAELREALGAGDTETALAFAEALETAGRQSGEGVLIGKALFFRAFLQPDDLLALEWYKEALAFFQGKDHVVWRLHTHNNIADRYWDVGYFNLAIESYQRALDAAKQLEDVYYVISMLTQMALLYADVENAERGVYYGKQALKAALAMPEGIERNYFIAKSRNTIGINFDNDGQYDSALVYHFENLNDTASSQAFGLFSVYNNIGNTYSKMGRWRLAGDFWKRAAKIEDLSDYNRSTLYLNLGRYYGQSGNHQKAFTYLQAALEKGQAAQNYEKIRDAWEALSNHYEQTGNLSEALDYSKRFRNLKDSLLSEAKYRAIAEMEIQYDTKQKEATNLLLSKQNAEKDLLITRRNNQLLWATLGMLILLFAALSIWLFWHFRQRERATQAQKALQSARFSAVMETEEKERARIARELHDGLGQVLTSARLNVAALDGEVAEADAPLLQNAMGLIDRSIIEIRAISHNMMPASLTKLGLLPALKDMVDKINMAGKVTVVAQLDALEQIQLQESMRLTIYRCIQELLNNVLKHASASRIGISATIETRALRIQIEDNGTGFDIRQLEASSGLGWASMQSRLEWHGGSLTVKSTPDFGTRTKLLLPIETLAP
jgi:two-component system NarL family sensor kinase